MEIFTCERCGKPFSTDIDSDFNRAFCSLNCAHRFTEPLDYLALVVSDSGTIGKNGQALGITYSYCLIDDMGELIKEVSGVSTDYKTSPMGETYGCLKALEEVTRGQKINFWCDCLYALKMTFESDFHDGYFWKSKKLDPRLVEMREELKTRLDFNDISIELLKGHASKAQIQVGHDGKGKRTSIWNNRVDANCTEEAEKFKANLEKK